MEILNELRRGKISPTALSTFKSLSRPLAPSPLHVAPTELYPLRADVNRANLARLVAIKTPIRTFVSRDSGSAGDEQRQKLLAGMMAVDELRIKIGAQVMLIKNLGEGPGAAVSAGGGLVNGSVGLVVGFRGQGEVCGDVSTSGSVRNVRLAEDGETPLAPASSKAEEDKENQAAGETVKDESKGKPKQEPKPGVKQETKPISKGKGKNSDEFFPLVRFPTAQGSETVLLLREEFRIEDNEGKLLARRMQVRTICDLLRVCGLMFGWNAVQVPLILAWAMSIHKSQGQTIHRVKVDLGKVFEKGPCAMALL